MRWPILGGMVDVQNHDRVFHNCINQHIGITFHKQCPAGFGQSRLPSEGKLPERFFGSIDCSSYLAGCFRAVGKYVVCRGA